MLASSNLLDPAATHGVSFSCTNATLFTSQRQISIDPVECRTAHLEGWLKYETKKTWQQEPEEAKLYSLKDKSETDFAKGHVRWQSFLGLLFKQYKRRIRNCWRVSLVFVPRDGILWHNCCWNTLSFNLFFFSRPSWLNRLERQTHFWIPVSSWKVCYGSLQPSCLSKACRGKL